MTVHLYGINAASQLASGFERFLYSDVSETTAMFKVYLPQEVLLVSNSLVSRQINAIR